MIQRLEWILAQINGWLAFAEAKNGALFVFNGAILATVAQISSHSWPANGLGRAYLVSGIVCLASGMIVALFSFLPKTQIPLLTPSQQPGQNDNLLFFGHIKKYSTADYLARLASCYSLERTDSGMENDLANQVVTNARIAVWKYSCFKVGLWLTICALASVVIGPLVLALLYSWSQSHD